MFYADHSYNFVRLWTLFSVWRNITVCFKIFEQFFELRWPLPWSVYLAGLRYACRVSSLNYWYWIAEWKECASQSLKLNEQVNDFKEWEFVVVDCTSVKRHSTKTICGPQNKFIAAEMNGNCTLDGTSAPASTSPAASKVAPPKRRHLATSSMVHPLKQNMSTWLSRATLHQCCAFCLNDNPHWEVRRGNNLLTCSWFIISLEQWWIISSP